MVYTRRIMLKLSLFQELKTELAAVGYGNRPDGSVRLSNLGKAEMLTLDAAVARLEKDYGHNIKKGTLRNHVFKPETVLEGVWDQDRGVLAGVTYRSILEWQARGFGEQDG